MVRQLEKLLYDSDIDLGACDIIRDDGSSFVVRQRLGWLSSAAALLFGLPCLLLAYHAVADRGIYLILAPLFCPPLAFLSLAYGLARPKKVFRPDLGQAIKSYDLMGFERKRIVDLPGNGSVVTFKRLQSTSGAGAHYRYFAAIDGIPGLGFSVAKDESIRDRLARDLADFLNYEIRNEDS